jgi:hypothetical protein
VAYHSSSDDVDWDEVMKAESFHIYLMAVTVRGCLQILHAMMVPEVEQGHNLVQIIWQQNGTPPHYCNSVHSFWLNSSNLSQFLYTVLLSLESLQEHKEEGTCS